MDVRQVYCPHGIDMTGVTTSRVTIQLGGLAYIMVIIESLTIGPNVVGLSYPRGAVTTYLAFRMMMMMMVIKIVQPCLSVNPVLSWMLLDSLCPNQTSNRFGWGGYVCEVGFQRA